MSNEALSIALGAAVAAVGVLRATQLAPRCWKALLAALERL